MARSSNTGSVGRRRFLVSAVSAGAAAGLATAATAQTDTTPAPEQPAEPKSATPAPEQPPEPKSAIPAHSPAAEKEPPPEAPRLTTKRTGSDFMVDVIKTLDIDYATALPGSTFRGLQESIINYGGNKGPEWLTCLHEESSVAMAHGYAKVAGKPMAAVIHGTVGTQHASMAIYNAYADRVPMLLLTGNASDANKRRPGVEWAHSVQDGALLVRDFTKWDDSPASLQHFAESMVQAYKIATTVPMAPVLIVADTELQEGPLEPQEETKLRIPKLTPVAQPQGDVRALGEIAKLLVAADNPVIVADRYARTPDGMALLVQLAETAQAPVADLRGRMNFPKPHPLNHSDRFAALIARADFILALEPVDLFGLLNRMRDQLERTSLRRVQREVKVATIGSGPLLIKANYQDFQRYSAADLAVVGDAEATLPTLIEEVNRALDDGRKSQLEARGQKLAEAAKGFIARARADAAPGWDASPISTARMCMELWAQIKNEDWSFVSETFFISNWPHRLWSFDKPYRHIGGSGAAGVGYSAPAAVGAALANKALGRLTVAIVGDGELMIAPGVLWTAAHHKIPLLMLVHNNRAYHQETMHIQRMANRHNRGVESAHIGTAIAAPNIDYAKLAQSMGMLGIGPITDPGELGPAIQIAVATVKRGEPALIDVVSQPR